MILNIINQKSKVCFSDIKNDITKMQSGSKKVKGFTKALI